MPRDRLELFIQACEAINHAHTKALIHRDIKAGNVLAYLSDGKPIVKVIDFGIAKALTGDRLTEQTFNTERGQVIGTYETMSPEQADGSPDIDTRTDVYSLGVLLYELLSGVKPFDITTYAKASDHELRRIIREVDPPRPSTQLSGLGESGQKIADVRGERVDALAGRLKAELEWIPLKALRKERSRRYASALQLADDIRNYRDGKPLLAGPESRAYRAKKFLRRNAGAVAAAAAVSIAILAGTAVSIALAIRLKQTADARQVALNDARAAYETSEDAIKFFTEDVIGTARPNDTMLQALERTAGARHFGDSPRVEVAVRTSLALIYFGLGRVDAALPYAEQAMDIGNRELGPDHPATIRSTSNLAALLRVIGRPADAEPLCRAALQRAREVLGNDHPDTLVFMSNMASVLQEQGQLEPAEPLFRESLQGKRSVLGEHHPETLNSLNLLASLLKQRKQYDEAERLAREALQAGREHLDPNHPKSLQAQRILGEILMEQERYADAEPISRDSLARRREVFASQPLSILMEIENLGRCLHAQGKFDEAETLYAELYQRAPSTHMDPRVAARFVSCYGLLLAERQKYIEAEAPLKRAHEKLVEAGLRNDGRTREVLSALVATATALGNTQDAARWTTELSLSGRSGGGGGSSTTTTTRR